MQNRRGLIFLGFAVAMGIVAAWLTQRLVSTSSPEMSLETTPVVVLRTDVPVATSLTLDQLQTTDWPSDHVPRGALRSTDQAVGRVVRRPVAAGEPVLEMALFDTGTSGGLPAMITSGHRAVTVKVDNVIGVAGFVTPGAHVDVLATIRRIDLESAPPYSKVILQNIKVLAVDQKLEEAKTGDPEIVSVVTLEVDPVQAEHLIYAAHEGRLQLAMRSPDDQQDVRTRSISVVDVLGEPEVRKTAAVTTRPRSPGGGSVQIINGSQVQAQRF
jgi:pilus assembly protein CpaB